MISNRIQYHINKAKALYNKELEEYKEKNKGKSLEEIRREAFKNRAV